MFIALDNIIFCYSRSEGWNGNIYEELVIGRMIIRTSVSFVVVPCTSMSLVGVEGCKWWIRRGEFYGVWIRGKIII
jgi:hypothetical protein